MTPRDDIVDVNVDDIEPDVEPSPGYDYSWMKKGDDALVRAQELREQAEEMSYAAAEACIDAQVCANELQFLYTPRVIQKIDEMRAQVNDILDEYEDMFGTAADPSIIAAAAADPGDERESAGAAAAAAAADIDINIDISPWRRLAEAQGEGGIDGDGSSQDPGVGVGIDEELEMLLEEHVVRFEEKRRNTREMVACMTEGINELLGKKKDLEGVFFHPPTTGVVTVEEALIDEDEKKVAEEEKDGDDGGGGGGGDHHWNRPRADEGPASTMMEIE